MGIQLVFQFSSVTQSCLTLWLHGLQHSRLPSPSSTLGACANLCLCWWFCPTFSSSIFPFSCLQFFLQVSGAFLMNKIFASGGQSIGVSALVLPINIQGWLHLGLIGMISFHPRDSHESSPAPQFKSTKSLALSFFYSLTFTSIHDYWKNHGFDFITKLCLYFLICCLGW